MSNFKAGLVKHVLLEAERRGIIAITDKNMAAALSALPSAIEMVLGVGTTSKPGMYDDDYKGKSPEEILTSPTVEKKCTCGMEKAGGGAHSDWCDIA